MDIGSTVTFPLIVQLLDWTDREKLYIPCLKESEISRVTWLFFRRLELNSEQTEDLVRRLSSERQLITFEDFKTGLVELIERMNNATDDDSGDAVRRGELQYTY